MNFTLKSKQLTETLEVNQQPTKEQTLMSSTVEEG